MTPAAAGDGDPPPPENPFHSSWGRRAPAEAVDVFKDSVWSRWLRCLIPDRIALCPQAPSLLLWSNSTLHERFMWVAELVASLGVEEEEEECWAWPEVQEEDWVWLRYTETQNKRNFRRIRNVKFLHLFWVFLMFQRKKSSRTHDRNVLWPSGFTDPPRGRSHVTAAQKKKNV